MKKKQSLILVPIVLALVVGIRAVKNDQPDPRQQAYVFSINDFKKVVMSRLDRQQAGGEKQFIHDTLLNAPQEYKQFPLAQRKGQTFVDTKGEHIIPTNKDDIVNRADVIHSKGTVKDLYKLKKSPWTLGSSKVVCLTKRQRGRKKLQPKDYGYVENFKYMFPTKAENTKWGTIHYSCFVTDGSTKIKALFDRLPGKIEDGIKIIGKK